MNAIANRTHQFGRPTFQQTTTTTTTTYHNGNRIPGRSHHQNPFANANQGHYNNPSPWNSAAGGGIQLSSKAQMMMTMLGMMNSLMGGNFGQLMNMLGGMNGRQMPQGYGPTQTKGGPPQGIPSGRPAFGSQAGRGVSGGQVAGANLPGMKPGQVKEMKAGQTAKGANGSVVKWGQDGTVTVDYRDKNGQNKNISVKNGMLSLDGGKPQKLENVGQLLKLPNGDVVGLGNNPGPNGKSLVRVVMADSVKNVRTEPASATNIYDVANMEHKRTSMEGGGISLNVNAGSYSTPFGGASFMNASLSAFAGFPVTRSSFEQLMSLVGSK